MLGGEGERGERGREGEREREMESDSHRSQPPSHSQRLYIMLLVPVIMAVW